MVKLYLDISVLMAVWLSESKRFVYMPQYLDQLVELAKECKYWFVISSVHEAEFKKKYSFLLTNFKDFISERGSFNKLIKVELSDEKVSEAKKITKKYESLHAPDSFHLALAKNHADIFVTEDKSPREIALNEIDTRLIEELF